MPVGDDEPTGTDRGLQGEDIGGNGAGRCSVSHNGQYEEADSRASGDESKWGTVPLDTAGKAQDLDDSNGSDQQNGNDVHGGGELEGAGHIGQTRDGAPFSDAKASGRADGGDPKLEQRGRSTEGVAPKQIFQEEDASDESPYRIDDEEDGEHQYSHRSARIRHALWWCVCRCDNLTLHRLPLLNWVLPLLLVLGLPPLLRVCLWRMLLVVALLRRVTLLLLWVLGGLFLVRHACPGSREAEDENVPKTATLHLEKPFVRAEQHKG